MHGRWAAGWLAATLVLAGGCPRDSEPNPPAANTNSNGSVDPDDPQHPQPPGSHDPDPGNSNANGAGLGEDPGGGGGGDGGGAKPAFVLPAGTLDDILPAVAAGASALGALRALAEPGVNLAEGAFVTTGPCPQVSMLSGADFAGVHLNFGAEGCTGSALGWRRYATSVPIGIRRTQEHAAATLDGLAIDGRPVSGTVDFTLLDFPRATHLDGTCDLLIGQERAMRGGLELRFGRTGLQTWLHGDLTLTVDGLSRDVQLANVRIDPAGNRNFVPEAGTLQFDIDDAATGSHRVMVTFDTRTPAAGLVRVAIDGRGAKDQRVSSLLAE